MISNKPILLNGDMLKVIIFGYGTVGKRKADKYLNAQATVYVVDPRCQVKSPNHFSQSASDFLTLHLEEFLKCHLVIAATNCPKTNAEIVALCHRYGKLVNSVDNPMASHFSDMHFMCEDHYLLAASGLGKSPYVAQYLIDKLQNFLKDPALLKRVSLIAKATPFLKKKGFKGKDLASLSDEALERMTYDEEN